MSEETQSDIPQVLSDSFTRMDQHRRKLRPTLTTLAGPVGLAGRLWRTWIAASQRATVIPRDFDPAEILQAWIQAVVESPSLPEQIDRYLADLFRFTPSELEYIKSAPLVDRNLFFQRAANVIPAEVLPVVRCCLEFSPQQSWASRWQQLRATLPELSGQSLPSLEPFQRFLSPDSLPAILIYIPEQDVPARVADKLELGAWLVTQFPWLSIAVAITPTALERYTTETPDSFLKGVALDSVLPVRGLKQTEIAAQLSSLPGSGTTLLPELPVPLQGLGKQDLEVITQAAATILTDQPHPHQPVAVQQQQSDAARSAAERLLFLLLENMPETAGLFELNLKPGFQFGSQPAELDLASHTLRIAIEVDGYYHFTAPDCYRRDRRKDVLLQQHGFFILRFLAEDIFPCMEQIRTTILAVVKHRRNSS